MKIKIRSLMAVVVAALISVAGAPPPAAAKKPPTVKLQAGPIDIAAKPINYFQRLNPTVKRFGKLEFLGGLTLSSKVPQFGGWSDLAIDPDGKRVLVVSDDGMWLSADLTYEGLKLTGLSGAQIGPLRALSGRALRGKKERDAEGVVLASGTIGDGELLISFERIHRIGRFKTSGSGVVGPLNYIKLPRKAHRLRKNKGLEAVTIARGGPLQGAIVAFGERPRKGFGNRSGWVVQDGKSFRFKLRDIGDLDVTAAASLANGDILVLERRFRIKEWFKGITIRLRRIKAAHLRAGAIVDAEILLEANSSNEVDNMEGLAIHDGPNGRTIISMISDDNFNKFLQSTVLLQFSLLN